MAKKFFMWWMILFFQPVYAASHVVYLGSERVVIEKHKHASGPIFVHLHQNEKTALAAARMVVASSGGSLITLKHHGGRNIVFYLDHQRYEFDPNRIFTEKGIEQTLRRYGHYSRDAHLKVRKLANDIKKMIPAKGKVIAVHNNQNYSLEYYKSGASLASDVRALYVDHQQSHRNFFLVTRKRDFLYLKQLGYNSIWQKSRPTDDGSLSVYLAKKRYINVEAGHHQLQSQIRMLHQIA